MQLLLSGERKRREEVVLINGCRDVGRNSRGKLNAENSRQVSLFFSSFRFRSPSGRWTSSFDKWKERKVVRTVSPRVFLWYDGKTSMSADHRRPFVRSVSLPSRRMLVIQFYDFAWLSRKFWVIPSVVPHCETQVGMGVNEDALIRLCESLHRVSLKKGARGGSGKQ